MRLVFTFIFSCLIVAGAYAQPTFKCGWTQYKTTMIIHEFTYSYVYKDSFKLFLADSTKTFVAPDSQVTLKVSYPFRQDKDVYQTADYYNAKRKLVKSEDYKDKLLQVSREFKYDDKNRKIYSFEDNKASGNNYKRLLDYSVDKGCGEVVITESSYFNGRIEFYTKSFFDKNSVKVKEIRLNDNNKDVVHVENFFYNAAGRLRERTVFFPEFKVTKTFPEFGSEDPAKCFKSQVLNISDKPALGTKVGFLRKLLNKNQGLLLDKDCHDFEYRFFNSDCEVIIGTTKTNNVKQVIFRFKEKVAG